MELALPVSKEVEDVRWRLGVGFWPPTLASRCWPCRNCVGNFGEYAGAFSRFVKVRRSILKYRRDAEEKIRKNQC